ncbi:MAG: signal peptidase I [Steroidobacteraceae bacterium]
MTGLMKIVEVLAWLALPVAFICTVDDWFLRPRRRVAAYPAQAQDPVWMRACYLVLPVLVCAVVVRLLRAERLDFSLLLVVVAGVSGIVYGLDALIFSRQRAALAQRSGKQVAAVLEPGLVDYARSFFPVAIVVLVLRAFIFEPFRIPSDSMMPTLLDGDFILVNKFAYGLRVPVLNTKVVSIGAPERGDIVVFRFPPDPAVNYIKRLVGLPGDRVRIENDQIFVNDAAVVLTDIGPYSDGCYQGLRMGEEVLGTHTHRTMYCRTSGDLSTSPLPGCNRRIERGYICPDEPPPGADKGNMIEITVPAGEYFMIGDNRDNSADSRYFGFVPEANLVGKAKRIWFNWDMQRSGGPNWSRIGTRIE